MEFTTSVALCGKDATTIWRTLLTISGTINGLLIIYAVICHAIKMAYRWKNTRLPTAKRQLATDEFGDFINKHRGYLAALMADALVTLTLFVGALYLLITGAISKPFVANSNTSCNMIATATILSAIAIGRLCVVIVMTFRHQVTFKSPGVAAQCYKQMLEQFILMLALLLMLGSSQAMLIKALFLIMQVDQNTYSLGFLLSRYPEVKSRVFVMRLKVIQCFLSVAFRGAVPLASLVVALTVYDDNILAMDTRHQAVFIGCAIVFVFYNTWVIIRATRDVWYVCSNHHDNTEKVPQAFFTNNTKPSMFRPKVPLDFDFTRNNTKMSHFVNPCRPTTDFDKYMDQHMPPPYPGLRPQRSHQTTCSVCVSQARKDKTTTLNKENEINKLTHITSPPLKPCSNLNCYTQQRQVKKNIATKKMYIKPDLTPDLPTIDEESESMVDVRL